MIESNDGNEKIRKWDGAVVHSCNQWTHHWRKKPNVTDSSYVIKYSENK